MDFCRKLCYFDAKITHKLTVIFIRILYQTIRIPKLVLLAMRVLSEFLWHEMPFTMSQLIQIPRMSHGVVLWILHGLYVEQYFLYKNCCELQCI